MSWGTEKYTSLLFIQDMHQFIFKKKQSQTEDYLRVQTSIYKCIAAILQMYSLSLRHLKGIMLIL